MGQSKKSIRPLVSIGLLICIAIIVPGILIATSSAFRDYVIYNDPRIQAVEKLPTVNLQYPGSVLISQTPKYPYSDIWGESHTAEVISYYGVPAELVNAGTVDNIMKWYSNKAPLFGYTQYPNYGNSEYNGNVMSTWGNSTGGITVETYDIFDDQGSKDEAKNPNLKAYSILNDPKLMAFYTKYPITISVSVGITNNMSPSINPIQGFFQFLTQSYNNYANIPE